MGFGLSCSQWFILAYWAFCLCVCSWCWGVRVGSSSRGSQPPDPPYKSSFRPCLRRKEFHMPWYLSLALVFLVLLLWLLIVVLGGSGNPP